jgi:hypothetical protein
MLHSFHSPARVTGAIAGERLVSRAMVKGRNIWVGVLLAWLVPGLGHFYMKRFRHGAFYLVAIAATYTAGMLIAEGTAVNYTLHEYYFYCQLLAGPITFGLEFLRGGEAIYLADSISILRHQTGVVYAATAGVLNLIVICELYRRWAQPEAPGPADTMRVGASKGGGDA